MINQHQKWMREAISESAYSVTNERAGGPFGSVVVKDGRIIARAHNQVLQNHDASAHGEVMAIRLAGEALRTFDLSGCDLYTSCEPCPMCLMACRWANVRAVYYAATRQDVADIGFRDEALYRLMRSDISTGEAIPACRDDAVAVMKAWAEKHTNGLY